MNRIRSVLAVVAALLACRKGHAWNFERCAPASCERCGKTPKPIRL